MLPSTSRWWLWLLVLLCHWGIFNNHANSQRGILGVHAAPPDCFSGTYLSSPSATACTNCPPFSSSDDGSNEISDCVCIDGYFGAAGTTSCSACGLGMYSSRATADYSASIVVMRCVNCTVGTHSSSVGSSACVLCGEGTYSTTRGATTADVCRGCPSNAGSSPGSSDFDRDCKCNAGFSGVAIATPAPSFVCQACARGSYKSDIGSARCTPCAPGTFGLSLGQTRSSDCLSCPPGTYSTTAGASSQQECTMCPAGSYSSQPSQASASSCRLCSAGSYASVSGSTSCTLCPVGTIANRVGSRDNETVSCTPCPAGTYAGAGEGRSFCFACPQDTFNPSMGATSIASCISCGVGASSFEGSNSTADCTCNAGYGQSLSPAPLGPFCSPCAEGTFRPFIPMNERKFSVKICSPCPAGTYQPSSLAVSCSPCPIGTYNPAIGSPTVLSCIPCPAGSSTITTGASSSSDACGCVPGYYASPFTSSLTCIPCATGMYKSNFSFPSSPAASLCNLCPAGTMIRGNLTILSAAVSVSDTCIGCSIGSFSSSAGASSCTQCPFGSSTAPVITFGGYSASSDCKCLPGYYLSGVIGAQSSSPLPVCTSCGIGSYKMELSSTTGCTLCPKGTFGLQLPLSLPSSVANGCALCPVGSYSEISGLRNISGCISCPVGTYSSSLGADSRLRCQMCPPFSTTAFEGSISLAQCRCSAGYYRSPSPVAVTVSPCILCAPGTYRSFEDPETACLPCPLGSFSSEFGLSAAAACVLCRSGSFGIAEGQNSEEFACTPCSIHSTSPAGASSAAMCACNDGYALSGFMETGNLPICIEIDGNLEGENNEKLSLDASRAVGTATTVFAVSAVAGAVLSSAFLPFVYGTAGGAVALSMLQHTQFIASTASAVVISPAYSAFASSQSWSNVQYATPWDIRCTNTSCPPVTAISRRRLQQVLSVSCDLRGEVSGRLAWAVCVAVGCVFLVSLVRLGVNTAMLRIASRRIDEDLHGNTKAHSRATVIVTRGLHWTDCPRWEMITYLGVYSGVMDACAQTFASDCTGAILAAIMILLVFTLVWCGVAAWVLKSTLVALSFKPMSAREQSPSSMSSLPPPPTTTLSTMKQQLRAITIMSRVGVWTLNRSEYLARGGDGAHDGHIDFADDDDREVSESSVACALALVGHLRDKRMVAFSFLELTRRLLIAILLWQQSADATLALAVYLGFEFILLCIFRPYLSLIHLGIELMLSASRAVAAVLLFVMYRRGLDFSTAVLAVITIPLLLAALPQLLLLGFELVLAIVSVGEWIQSCWHMSAEELNPADLVVRSQQASHPIAISSPPPIASSSPLPPLSIQPQNGHHILRGPTNRFSESTLAEGNFRALQSNSHSYPRNLVPAITAFPRSPQLHPLEARLKRAG